MLRALLLAILVAPSFPMAGDDPSYVLTLNVGQLI